MKKMLILVYILFLGASCSNDQESKPTQQTTKPQEQNQDTMMTKMRECIEAKKTAGKDVKTAAIECNKENRKK